MEGGWNLPWRQEITFAGISKLIQNASLEVMPIDGSYQIVHKGAKLCVEANIVISYKICSDGYMKTKYYQTYCHK